MDVVRFRDAMNLHRWQLVAGNGRIVACSGEGYHNLSDMDETIQSIKAWIRQQPMKGGKSVKKEISTAHTTSTAAVWYQAGASVPSNFAAELKSHLEADPKLSRRGKKVLELLNARPSKRKDRQIARMEAHVTVELRAMGAVGFAGEGAIDWSAIDWQKLLMTILEILIKLLPLLLMLF